MSVHITVGMADFRRALKSVACHASTSGKDDDMAIVRVIVDQHNVTVIATDYFTAGLAIASVHETDTVIDGDFRFDLYLDDAAKIISLFPPGKEAADEPYYLLRLEVSAKHLKVVDASGLIDGRAFIVPVAQTENSTLEKLPGLIGATIVSPPKEVGDMLVNGNRLARFKTAADCYREPLVIESHAKTRSLLIRCGESFLGLALPSYVDEDAELKRKEWAEAWEQRLPVGDDKW